MVANGRWVFPIASFLQDLCQASVEARRASVTRYEHNLSPHLGTSSAQTKWWTFSNVTHVTLWGRDHFWNNVKLFMVMQDFDLGPNYYCVMRTFNQGFPNLLFLILVFLPHQKIYVYPYYGAPFRGPFDRFVHLRRLSVDIHHCHLPLNEIPCHCPACHDCFYDHAM